MAADGRPASLRRPPAPPGRRAAGRRRRRRRGCGSAAPATTGCAPRDPAGPPISDSAIISDSSTVETVFSSSVLRLDAHRAQGRVRAPVVERDDRPRGAHPQQVWRHQQHRRRLRAGDRDVLRHHLAEQHVQHHHDRDRDDERHRVQHRVGDADQVERLLQQVGHRGLADPAQQDRADRDAQLRAGQHQRQVLARPGSRSTALRLPLLGERFQPVAARRDQRELRADEERVGAEQQHGQQHAEEVSPSAAAFVVAAAAQLGEFEQIDPSAVHPDHRGQPADRVLQRAVGIERPSAPPSRRVRGCGPAPAAPGRRWSRIRPRAPGNRSPRADLVDAQQPRNLPAAARRHDVGRGLVVLVADVADDLLDQVLDRHHARGAAVFVDDQCGLQARRPGSAPSRRHRPASRAPWRPAAPGRPAGFPPASPAAPRRPV